MKKVHILPQDVISKIAAGEVIERPASVVKELVENALDANATSIEVHLTDAGKTLLQVKDNGHGIEHADLDKIFLRHATSKIEKSEDLFNIMSLGFRGEALYSIASIADVSLQTKTDGQDSGPDASIKTGWEAHIRGGEQIDLRPCAKASHGTDIKIKELFFNTPARKKFLKANTTEINQILNIFIPYTLLYPNNRFRLNHQGRDLVDLAPSLKLTGRMAHALNLNEKHMLEIKQDFPQKHYHIRMILGDMNIQRTRRDMQFIFVNNRPVQNKSISYHLNQIYRLIMPEGAFPFFAVYIQMPADELDVNIHPAKREVKIKDERALCSLLRSICEEALMKSSRGKQIEGLGAKGQGQEAIEHALRKSNVGETSYDSSTLTDIFDSRDAKNSPTEDYTYPRASVKTQEFYVPPNNLFTENQDNLQNKFKQARYIGSFINKYLLFEADQSLLLVDQHAAQERIMYEQLIQQMDKGSVEIQQLLSPVLLKVIPQEMLVWEESKEKLEEMGFSTNQWDNETIAVHSHPQLLKDIEKSVRHLLAGENIAKCNFETLARRACRSSVMTGDKLSQKQAEYQREQLIKCLDPFTCPHGRPTIIEISADFLDKQFFRT